jgi:hypothetical protein
MSEDTEVTGQASAAARAAADRAAEARLKAISVIEYELPGRLRVRLKKQLRTREIMDTLLEKLETTPGIHKVVANHRTGSITIYYDRNLSLGDIAATIASERKVNERAAAERLKVLGEVEEYSPGHIRLRLKPELRTPEMMQTVEHMIEQDPLIRDVTVDQKTGTIVIEFTKTEAAKEMGKSALAEAELIAATLFELPEGEGEGGGGYGKLDQQIAGLLYKIDRAVYRKTGLKFRGQILSGSIAGLGVLQMVIYGISLEMLPGPLLIYIGWDIYHRVSQEPAFDYDDIVEEEPQEARQTAPGIKFPSKAAA